MFINMTKKERGDYSLSRGILAQLAANPRAAAPNEYGISDAVTAAYGQASPWGALRVPSDVLFAKRDLTTASGAPLIAQEVPPFEGALREASWVERLPLQRMTGLRANQSVPRHGSNVSVTWLGDETSQVSEQSPSFGTVSFTPKFVSVIIERSRQHLLQAADQDAGLMRELGLSLGAAIATACAAGTGTNGQPLGALGQTSQSESGTSLALANLNELIRLVEAAGGSNITALVGTGAAKTFRAREKASGNGGFLLQGGFLGDVPCIVTNVMPTDAIIIGDWSRAMFCSWGAPVEIVATQTATAANFASGIVSIRAIAAIDFGLLHATGFAKSVSIT